MAASKWVSVPQSEGSTAPPVTRSDEFASWKKRALALVLFVGLFVVIVVAVRKEQAFQGGSPTPSPPPDLSDIVDVQSTPQIDTEDGDELNSTTLPEKKSDPNPLTSIGEGQGSEKTKGTSLSKSALAFSKTIGERCPAWSAAFRESYVEKCGFWFDLYLDWAQKSLGKKSVGYLCLDERRCHGLGDRLAGIQGIFNAALEAKRPLKVGWKGLDSLFQSCLFGNVSGAQWGHDLRVKPHGCMYDHPSACIPTLSQTLHCPDSPVWFENSDRTCLSDSMCKRAIATFPQTLNTANIYGCGLRALFEPKAQFLKYVIPFREAEKGLKQVTVEEAQQIMSKYYVIGIHFRLGDRAAFFRSKTREISASDAEYLLPFQCAATIQSHLERRPFQAKNVRVARKDDIHYVKQPTDDEYTVDGRPVRWFLASDTSALRDLAVELFGDKLLMIETRPSHIAFSASRKPSVLSDTFAEWYLLGLSENLVVNRIGGRDLYNGRISSFSKTSWVYQLKSIVYDAGNCRQREIILDGTWKTPPPACRRSSALNHRLDQPHLVNIESVAIGNASFPKVWIEKGIPSVLDPSLVPETGTEPIQDEESQPETDERR